MHDSLHHPQVNDTDIMSMTHEEAATVLKNAGDSVKLLVEYKPDGVCVCVCVCVCF